MSVAIENLVRVRSIGPGFHVLRDEKGLVLIDAGFVGGIRSLRRSLCERGWANEKIVGIILTHGHLDHILNVGRLVAETGAWICAPRPDLAQYQGRQDYEGWARVTGMLESIGRPLLGFKGFVPDRLLDDGDVLDVWHGLRAVSFSGHTAGHMGYYCDARRLLFSADLFASYEHFSHPPPRIFNSDPGGVLPSIEKALGLDLRGVLPNHGDDASPEIHLERMRRMFDRRRAS